MKKKIIYLLIILGSALNLSTSSHAASWYIRGSISGEWSRSADFFDRDSTATNPPALFGTTPGSDGRSIGAYGDFGRFLGLEGAVGAYVLPWLRMDLSNNYRPHMKYSGQANFAGVPGAQPVSATASSVSLMCNIFIEPMRLAGFSPGRFRPYLGGGLGLAYNRIDGMTYLFPGLKVHKISITPSGKKMNRAFMVTVGTVISLSRKVFLDVAYRYTDLGRVRTEAGRMYMNNLPAGIEISETRTRLRSHGIFLGLGYSF